MVSMSRILLFLLSSLLGACAEKAGTASVQLRIVVLDDVSGAPLAARVAIKNAKGTWLKGEDAAGAPWGSEVG
jgi:hypothetical protein